VIIVDCDIETRSSVDLKKSNVYAYSESDDFEVLMMGYGVDDGPVEVVEGHEAVVKVLRDLLAQDTKFVAHNAGFERVALSRALGMPVGEYLAPEAWLDTAALAALYGLPRSLDGAAKALGLTPKDSAGTRLINLFCKPHKGAWVEPGDRPEDWGAFVEYCLTRGHRVLRDDMRWVDISEVQEGDTILGFDEEPARPGLARHWRRALVDRVQRVEQPVHEVTLESGKTFTVTGEHRWLVRPSYNRGWGWKTTLDLTPSDCTGRFLDPWDRSETYEDGWLAGMFDGEGHLSVNPGAKGSVSLALGVSQREGAAAERLHHLVNQYPGVELRATRAPSGVLHMRVTGRRPAVLRFLGTVRPERLLAKVDFDLLGRMEVPTLDRVVSVEPAGVQEIFAVATTTGTLLVDGYPMHNCRQDVETMREFRHVVRGWPADGFERRLWYVDQRVNDRGMRVDVDLALGAVEVAKANTARAEAEVQALTGVANPGSTKQLGDWCEGRGFVMENWQRETVADALGRADTPDEVAEVLRLRQELALVAHRKFEAVARGVSSDGRLRGQFRYHAAHTGRWSSQGVQLHNLPRLSFEYRDEEGSKHYDEVAEDAFVAAVTRRLAVPPATLKRLVRPMILLDGVTSDFSAIEARVLAWISGEQWVLDAFEAGRELYVEQAQRMGDEMTRQDGKIAILAGGYQGSVGSFRNMGYGGRRCARDTLRGDLKRAGSAAERAEVERRMEEGHAAEAAHDPGHRCDAEILPLVRAYREANPAIVEFWRDMERRFWTGGAVGAGLVRVEVPRAGVRRVHLPSGRTLRYYGVHRREGKVTDPDTGEVTGTRTQIAYRHVQGYTETTYGGRLTENCLAADTLVLTEDGWLPITAAGGRRVWDGVEWVDHGGCLYNGYRQTLDLDGVRMTGDHLVLTNTGWAPASSREGLDRASVRLPDGAEVRGLDGIEVALAGQVRLRDRARSGRRGTPAADLVRLPDRAAAVGVQSDPRDVQAPGLRGVAGDDRAVRAAGPRRLAQLRGARGVGLRSVARLLGVLGGHGADVPARAYDRALGQRWGLRAGELRLGHGEGELPEQAEHPAVRNAPGAPHGRGDLRADRAGAGHTLVPGVARVARLRADAAAGRDEAVYDLVNCGPRSRFTVLGESGPMMVHNCTQAVARDLLADALVRLDAAGYRVVGHVHDEALAETDDAEGVREVMRQGPAWAEGLPLDASAEWLRRYRKS
jgi:hypothetical protein